MLGFGEHKNQSTFIPLWLLSSGTQGFCQTRNFLFFLKMPPSKFQFSFNSHIQKSNQVCRGSVHCRPICGSAESNFLGVEGFRLRDKDGDGFWLLNLNFEKKTIRRRSSSKRLFLRTDKSI